MSLSVWLAVRSSGWLSVYLYLAGWLAGWLVGSLFNSLSVSIHLSVRLAGWLCLSICLYSSVCLSGWLAGSVCLTLSHSTAVSYSHLSGVFNADTRHAVSHLNKFVLVFFCFLTRREMRVPFDEEMIH